MQNLNNFFKEMAEIPLMAIKAFVWPFILNAMKKLPKEAYELLAKFKQNQAKMADILSVAATAFVWPLISKDMKKLPSVPKELPTLKILTESGKK